MAVDVSITLTLSNSCPDLIFNRVIAPTFSTQLQPSDFNQYATLELTYPNGEVLNLSSLDPDNWLDPTLDTISFETLLVGLFQLSYTALPSPRASQSQNYYWVATDNFYYEGKIYQVNANGITIPNTAATNDAQIATYLSNGDLTIVDISEINPQYIATILPGNTFQFWCNLVQCLIDRQHKLNKQNLKGLNVNSIKEVEELDIILQLYFIYNYLLVNTLDPTNPTQYQMIVTFSNYINTICGCNNCGKPNC